MYPARADRPVTTPYGKKGSAWATGEHGGIDYGCPTGDPVYAMWGGTVTSKSWGSAYGTHVVIDHDHLPDGSPGLWAVYAHLSSRSVSSGQRVEAGQQIGKSGATGNVTGPHLHVEVQRDSSWQQGNYVNPQPWVDAGGASVEHGPVYLSKLQYGQEDSDSVKRLQLHLNSHSLAPPGDIMLPVTGGYFDQTDQVVRACQAQHGFGSDPTGGSSVGPQQAAHLFTGCACVITNDLEPVEPVPPDPTPPPDGGDVSYFHDYTGKPGGTLTVVDGQGYVPLDFKCKVPPFSGLEFHMLYANCEVTWDSSGDDGIIRVRYTRDAYGGEPADDTGYQDYAVPRGEAIGDPDGFLITATHWEAGEAGRGGKWFIRCDGAIKQIKIGTRYGKVGVVA